MNKEEEYKLTLLHIIKWLEGDGGFDSWKPVNSEFANKIVDIARGVAVEGLTLKDSVGKYGDKF